VIVGRLIPAGTGLAYHRARKAREAAERERAQAINDEEQSLFIEPPVVQATDGDAV
jgi:DNA-directed RNA polymerase subunit beta'